MHPSRTTRTCSPQRNASPPASPARPRGRVRMTDPPPWHTREPSAGRRQGLRSSLELGPDRLRVALAADEEPSRLVDTRCPVGLEALPYVLGVAGEHQGRPGLSVPVPIATAVQPTAASPPSAPCPGGAGDRRLAAPVLRPRCGVRPGRGPATEPGRPAPARSGARRPAPERELGGGDRPRYEHSAASTGHAVESRATRSGIKHQAANAGQPACPVCWPHASTHSAHPARWSGSSTGRPAAISMASWCNVLAFTRTPSGRIELASTRCTS